MKKKTTISADIINILWKEENLEVNLKLKEIGSLMDGLSQTFLSRVAAGTRNLRLEHLTLLEKSLDFPLPWLILLTDSQRKNVSKDDRAIYLTVLEDKLKKWKDSQNKKKSSKKKSREG